MCVCVHVLFCFDLLLHRSFEVAQAPASNTSSLLGMRQGFSNSHVPLCNTEGCQRKAVHSCNACYTLSSCARHDIRCEACGPSCVWLVSQLTRVKAARMPLVQKLANLGVATRAASSSAPLMWGYAAFAARSAFANNAPNAISLCDPSSFHQNSKITCSVMPQALQVQVTSSGFHQNNTFPPRMPCNGG